MSYLDDYLMNSNAEAKAKQSEQSLTLGVVVDTNDPQQRGRVRVMCPSLGDNPDPATMSVDDLPWALVITQNAGFVDQGFRANGDAIDDEVAYGMFTPPKVGAQALVSIIDGNYSLRVVLGFVFDMGGVNTLPHGRFQVEGGSSMQGPSAVGGSTIEPLNSNMRAAYSNPFFGGTAPTSAFEWMSRVSDRTVGAHRQFDSRPTQSGMDDDGALLVEMDGRASSQTQGYAPSRIGATPEMSGQRDSSLEPQTSCWVTPGFHAISMDDRRGNTRMRFRTSTGHQILLDDTNERIYIATNKGNSWLEMDSCGNIDMYSETRVSIHGAKDVNITAGESLRLMGNDVQIKSTLETRLTAGADIGVHSNTNIRMGALIDTYMQAGVDSHFLCGNIMYLTSGANMNLNSGGSVFTTSAGTNETLAGGSIIESAPMINMNSGAPAAPAAGAEMAAEQPARHTNRVPQHEPWPRMQLDPIRANMTEEESKAPGDVEKWTSPPIVYNGSNPQDLEHKSFTSPLIGRVDDGVVHVRNKHWRR